MREPVSPHSGMNRVHGARESAAFDATFGRGASRRAAASAAWPDRSRKWSELCMVVRLMPLLLYALGGRRNNPE